MFSVRTIDQVRTFTNKPVLLSETAIGPSAGQAAKMGDLFHGMHQYRTLGLIWFDIAQHQGLYHQDWRIEDNPGGAGRVPAGSDRDDASAPVTPPALSQPPAGVAGGLPGGPAAPGWPGCAAILKCRLSQRNKAWLP